jgi:Flp pilus assembly protein TadB
MSFLIVLTFFCALALWLGFQAGYCYGRRRERARTQDVIARATQLAQHVIEQEQNQVVINGQYWLDLNGQGIRREPLQ